MNGPTLERTVHIAAPPEVVWEFWTVAERMCEWWGADAELDPTPGGTMRVTLGGGGVMAGRYVELDPPRRLVFRFGWEATAGAPVVPPESTTVEVVFGADGDGTVLTLRHFGLPAGDAEAQHRSGWTHFLGELAGAARRDPPEAAS